MKYRGMEFLSVDSLVENFTDEVVRYYRGQPIHQYVKHLPEANPEFHLRYQGLSSRPNSACLEGDMLVPPTAAPHPLTPNPAKVSATIVPLRPIMDTQQSEIHHQHLRQNLEHRLEVAQNQGNTELVTILEAERDLL